MSGDGNILESECFHKLGVLLKQILLQPSPKVKSYLVQKTLLKPIFKKKHPLSMFAYEVFAFQPFLPHASS